MAEQGTDEWLNERAGLATASNFIKVMAGKTTAAYQNYVTQVALERLFGKRMDTFSFAFPKTAAMQRGNDLEPVARMRYMLYTKQETSGAPPFKRHPTLMAGASIDDEVGPDGIAEYKAPLAHNHLHVLQQGKVPPVYKWQIVGGWLMYPEKLWTDFVSFSDEFPINAALAIIHVERNEDDVKVLENKLIEFEKDVLKTIELIGSYQK